MTQFPHDNFVKEYLPELCNDYGMATPSLDVKSETRQIDVFFVPDKPLPTTPETLGLFGKLLQQTCLLEVYRNPVQPPQIRECIAILNDLSNFRRGNPPVVAPQRGRHGGNPPVVAPQRGRHGGTTPTFVTTYLGLLYH